MPKRRARPTTTPTFWQAACLALASATLLIGCASLPLRDAGAAYVDTDVATGPLICRAMLARNTATADALDPSDLRLFNWNIRKSLDASSLGDLEAMAQDTDLVLIQEAALTSGVADVLDDIDHWSFAPGYESRATPTGVMTLSAAAPVSRCRLASIEPWLRTPKATSVTEYALAGTDETLAVVNVHAVNFTFGTGRFQEQFAEIAVVLEDHDGPVILSGDFNTWSIARMQIVNDLTESLGLKPVRFADDQRTTRFGHAIDHVYVRGLTELATKTHAVTSSDHNPMIVHFGMPHAGGSGTLAW